MPKSGTLLPSEADAVQPVLVFVICRVRLYHDAILELLNRQPGITAVGAADIAGDVMSDLQAAAPDVVVLDTGAVGALALALRMVRARPQTRILGFGVDDVAPKVVACAEAGLWGYVPNHASIGELAQAARRIASGDTVCSAAIAEKLFHHLRNAALGDSSPAIDMVLTKRQQQVLHLIKEGLSNKQIARRLSLGTSTVKNHVHSLLGRLQVSRRAEAAARIDARSCLE